MPAAVLAESDLDQGLLEITNGQDIDKIPNEDVEKLNKVLEFLLGKWLTEFEENSGRGQLQKKKPVAQEKLKDFIWKRMDGAGADFNMKMLVMETEDNKSDLDNFPDKISGDSGFYWITVVALDKDAVVSGRPALTLPFGRPVLTIESSRALGTPLILKPNEVFSMEFIKAGNSIS